MPKTYEMLPDDPTKDPNIARLDENGHEMVDPTPLAPPVGYQRQPSMVETIRNMVRSHSLAVEAERAGAETFEEGDDFDVNDPDDYDPPSPYEHNFEPPQAPSPPPPASPAPPPTAGSSLPATPSAGTPLPADHKSDHSA